MSKKNWSTLSLNSYKVDTSTLQNSIKELNSMKQQLQTTLSHYRLNEGNFIEESERLKDQIQILQRKLKQRPLNHDNCQNKISQLQNMLRRQQKEVIKYKEMYEIQRKNHEEVRQFYERKLKNWQDDHHLLVNKYEQRINSLASEVQQIRSASLIEKSRKSGNSKRQSVHQNQYSSSDNMESIHKSNKKSRTAGNIPSKSPSYGVPSSPHRHQTPHWKIQEEPDEELFETLIRKIYFETRDMGISSRDALMLPSIKIMKSNKAPSRKQITNFMKSPPVEEKDKINLQKNINYVENYLLKKYGRITGDKMVQFIIEKVEECENAQKMNSEDLSVSGITPSLNKASSYGLSSVSQSKNDKLSSKHNAQKRPSITEALKIDSEGSFIK